jgi:HSP20 family protein
MDDPPTLHVLVELPGVDPASVEVVAAGRTLTIAGTRERPTLPGARYESLEIEYGAFQRRLELPVEVDSANANATYERGMLKIVLTIESAR